MLNNDYIIVTSTTSEGGGGCLHILKWEKAVIWSPLDFPWGITKLRTSTSCGHLGIVIQTLQIKGLEI